MVELLAAEVAEDPSGGGFGGIEVQYWVPTLGEQGGSWY
jgi:hypothetical protein